MHYGIRIPPRYVREQGGASNRFSSFIFTFHMHVPARDRFVAAGKAHEASANAGCRGSNGFSSELTPRLCCAWVDFPLSSSCIGG